MKLLLKYYLFLQMIYYRGTILHSPIKLLLDCVKKGTVLHPTIKLLLDFVKKGTVLHPLIKLLIDFVKKLKKKILEIEEEAM